MTSLACLASTTAYASRQLRLWIVPWLLIGLLTSSSQGQLCPKSCRCIANEVDCSNASLTSFPSSLPLDAVSLDLSLNTLAEIETGALPVMNNVRYLKLDDNHIAELFANAFEKFPMLFELQLKSNRIANIQDGAFKNLNHLRILNLQNNRLSRLDKGVLAYLRLDALNLNYNVFQDLSSLHFDDVIVSELHLDGNDLSLIQKANFDRLSGSLKHLNLSFNRRSLVIDQQTFKDHDFSSISLTYNGLNDFSFLRYLTTTVLHLTGNSQLQMATLQSFTSLSSVEELYLDNCGITDVTASYFVHLSKLRVLHLSRNNISNLQADIFKNNPVLQEIKMPYNHIRALTSSFLSQLQLQSLDLRYNKIQTLSESLNASFNAIAQLVLHGNPFHCNCELRWFREWLTASDVSISDAYTCHTPKAEYLMVKRPEDFTCSKPVITFISVDKVVASGDDVFLSCNSEADPAPTVRFDSPFGGPEYTIVPGENKTNLRTFAAYNVPRFDASKSGTYTCHARNIAGVTSASVHVTLMSDTQSSAVHVDDAQTTQHSMTSAPAAVADVTQTISTEPSDVSLFAQTTEKPKGRLSNFHKIAIACGVAFLIAVLVLVMYFVLLYKKSSSKRHRYIMAPAHPKSEAVRVYGYKRRKSMDSGKTNAIVEV